MKVFPWTTKAVEQVLKGFAGNIAFKVEWPWATFHAQNFKALQYAAEKKYSKTDLLEIIENLSAPGAPKNLFSKLTRARALDEDGRIIGLDPAIGLKKTFSLAQENIEAFKNQDIVIPTIDDLLKRDQTIIQNWKPIFEEDEAIVEKWMANETSLLKSFQSQTPWSRLKVVESLVGVAKPLSVLNFERIY